MKNCNNKFENIVIFLVYLNVPSIKLTASSYRPNSPLLLWNGHDWSYFINLEDIVPGEYTSSLKRAFESYLFYDDHFGIIESLSSLVIVACHNSIANLPDLLLWELWLVSSKQNKFIELSVTEAIAYLENMHSIISVHER